MPETPKPQTQTNQTQIESIKIISRLYQIYEEYKKIVHKEEKLKKFRERLLRILPLLKEEYRDEKRWTKWYEDKEMYKTLIKIKYLKDENLKEKLYEIQRWIDPHGDTYILVMSDELKCVNDLREIKKNIRKTIVKERCMELDEGIYVLFNDYDYEDLYY